MKLFWYKVVVREQLGSPQGDRRSVNVPGKAISIPKLVNSVTVCDRPWDQYVLHCLASLATYHLDSYRPVPTILGCEAKPRPLTRITPSYQLVTHIARSLTLGTVLHIAECMTVTLSLARREGYSLPSLCLPSFSKEDYGQHGKPHKISFLTIRWFLNRSFCPS